MEGPEYPGREAMEQYNASWKASTLQEAMPILTPTYPHMNSAFNVSPSTLKVITDKMVQARDVCKTALEGFEMEPRVDEARWNELFLYRHIFHEFDPLSHRHRKG